MAVKSVVRPFLNTPSDPIFILFVIIEPRKREGSMLVEYIQAAMENADYKKLEDESWFAEIPGFEGVWANGKSVERCRRELVEVLEEWLILKIKDKDPIPVVKDIDINIKEMAAN